MAFTGRLGTPNSRFADIVFAAIDGFGPGSPDFQAHQLTSTVFRVLFSSGVTDGALDPAIYSLASGTGYVPDILSVEFYDERDDSVVVVLDAPLTTAAQYSVTVSSVETMSGDYVLGATKNFTANVVDPPRAMGAFLSKRGFVDVLFDKPVGPFSSAAAFSIAAAGGGPSVPMAQASWGGEGVPETTLRLQVPASLPTAGSFVIATSSVVDLSMNSSSESVPLTLALRSPSPFSYADVVQLQLLDAWVTDVSSDFLRAANVRVFFSCPVNGSEASSPSSWSLFAQGAHLHPDDQDVITAPAATDLPSLITLLNQLRSAFNSHVGVIDQVHLTPTSVTGVDAVTAPVASDLNSSVALVNALALAVVSHYLRSRVHLYQDTVNLVRVPTVGPGDLGAAIAAANVLVPSYSVHVLAEYPLQVSSAYHSPVGPITAYCQVLSPNLAFDVSGPLTYFADVRVTLDTEFPQVFVRATLTSEDGGSSCSPSDYTGSITARAAGAPAVVTSSLVTVDQWVDLRTDRNVSVLSDPPMVIVGTDGVEIPTDSSVLGSLPALLWAYNQAVESYRQHIIPGAAGHQTNETVNLVSPSDYGVLPLAAAISAANGVRLKIVAHMASATVHYHADPSFVTAPQATDLESYMALVADLTSVLASHLVRVGPHSFAGYRMVSAPVFDTIRLASPMMLDASVSRAIGPLQDSHVYNGLPVSTAPAAPFFRSHIVQLDIPFVALAVRPSLASALPQSGLSFDPVRGPVLGADSVLAFFSKPMREVPVDSSGLSFSGGPIRFLSSGWVSPVLASVAVTQMDLIPYTVTASGLADQAGNAVYT